MLVVRWMVFLSSWVWGTTDKQLSLIINNNANVAQRHSIKWDIYDK